MSANDGYVTGATPIGGTRLVTDPEVRAVLTLRRDTDARTAITRGLKEYLEQLRYAFAGREIHFKKVFSSWPEPEVDAVYPAATVYTADNAGSYDPESRFIGLLTKETKIEGTDAFAMVPCDFTQRVIVEAWTTATQERHAVFSMLEEALNPVEWMYGMRLMLPHYHGVHCTIEPMSSTYIEDDRDAQRRLRKMRFELDCHLPLIRVFPNMKTNDCGSGSVRISLTVTVGPDNIPTGLPGPDGGPGFESTQDID